MIKDQFITAAGNYRSTPDNSLKLWREVEEQYSHSSRHYHTIAHLENLLAELLPTRSMFENWNVVVFAIVYHDIVYKASKNNNEEKSAELAAKRLTSIACPDPTVAQCNEFILATKRHQQVRLEIDLFTDADLSILGSSPDTFQTYTRQVRKEYSIYPDLLYKPGRKKVLLHFLDMPFIYKTSFFREKYEASARRNLQAELALL